MIDERGDFHMEDTHIVQMYWDRNETAISESAMKYGTYCTSIAQNILQNPADAEECVNDTWLHAWNAMPPHRPSLLSTFLGKITRNLSYGTCGGDKPSKRDEMKELIAEINQFLQKLPEEKRCMFVLRYWYVDSIGEIAERLGRSENYISVSLNRIRGKLHTHLTERGFEL